MQKEKGKQSCKLAEEEGCERNPFRYARPARTPPPEARASLGPGHPRGRYEAGPSEGLRHAHVCTVHEELHPQAVSTAA